MARARRHCCLPLPMHARFNGQEFLRRWKGKKILFVGDSISLNQWESLACMLHAAAPAASKVAYARGNPVSSVTFQVRPRSAPAVYMLHCIASAQSENEAMLHLQGIVLFHSVLVKEK